MSSQTRLASLALAAAALAAPAAAQVVYSTDFSSSAGWTFSPSNGGSTWAIDATPPNFGSCGSAPYISAPSSLNFNDGATYGTDNVVSGVVTSPVIWLDPTQVAARATFWLSVDHEAFCAFDQTHFQVIQAGTGAVLASHCLLGLREWQDCAWREMAFPLETGWGPIQLRFRTQSFDTQQNTGLGVFVDDLTVDYGCGVDVQVVCNGQPSTAYPFNGANAPVWGARLTADGSPSVSGGTMNVHASQIRRPGFALLLAGLGPVQETFVGNTRLCIALQGVHRVGLSALTVTDEAHWSVPLGPTGPMAFAAPGDRVILQAYYRDSGSGNLSDAVMVQLCP